MEERRVERIDGHIAPGSPIDAPVREEVYEEYSDAPVARRTEVVTTEPGIARADVVRAAPTAAVDHVQATAYDPFAERRSAASKLVQAVWLVFGIIEGLLAIRFVLLLLGANASAGFAQLMYGITDPLVAPFATLFNVPRSGANVFDPNTIVALIVYLLLGWLVTKLIWLAVGETRTATTATADQVRTRIR